ncbi:MAG: phosphatase PAP2 family protein [Bacteroidaceae bacterium]|nr:phosphatase PAP2 family protein [Bacteroidaceae bacterium]
MKKNLTTSELLTLIYMGLTTVMLIFCWPDMENPMALLGVRLAVLCGMVVLNAIYRKWPCRVTWLMRIFPFILMLSYWYPETYQFARVFPYYDHVFAHADWVLFGCQPSIEFSKVVTSLFWCEAFNLGYYSYYFLMTGVLLFGFLCRFRQSERYAFIFLGCFFIYYLVFEFLPVAGPYYYFKAIGLEAAVAGNYPDMGNYFATHSELIHAPVRGVFSQWVHNIQVAGEHPVGAFPSSHVSMSTVTMLLAWRMRNKWLFWGLMPLYVLLCISTVYIMAHYVVDTLSGLLTAVLLFFLMDWLYSKIFRLMY